MMLHGHEFVPGKRADETPKRAGKIHVGFAGFINWRLLGPWLAAIAATDDLQLHLIGPVEGLSMAGVLGHSSVDHVPPVGKDDLLELLQIMHVLVMPYDPSIEEVSILTTNSKTFQYVASGRPIVISDLPHYIELPRGVIYKARTTEEFVETIRRAHAEDCPEFVELRRRIAAENTWDKRGDQLFEAIRQDMGGRFPIGREAEPETTSPTNDTER
jgi:glycosyltransferase involved in cell wall biosynthesis